MPKSKTQHRRRHHRNKSRKIRTRTRRGGVAPVATPAPVAHAAPAATPAPTYNPPCAASTSKVWYNDSSKTGVCK